MYKFKFADIGEGLHEGTVAEIYVKVGQQVEEGDSLFSVETDKVTSDIPSPVSGKIAKIEVKVGQLIHVGEEVFHIDDGTGAAEAAPAPKAETVEEAPAPAPKVEEKKEEAASVVGSIEVSNKKLDLDSLKTKSVKTGKVKYQDHVKTSPLARAIAAERGIDLTKIQGTGSNGKVLLKDLDATTPGKNISNARQNFAKKEDEVKKVTPLRKAIARAMKNS